MPTREKCLREASNVPMTWRRGWYDGGGMSWNLAMSLTGKNALCMSETSGCVSDSIFLVLSSARSRFCVKLKNWSMTMHVSDETP